MQQCYKKPTIQGIIVRFLELPMANTSGQSVGFYEWVGGSIIKQVI